MYCEFEVRYGDSVIWHNEIRAFMLGILGWEEMLVCFLHLLTNQEHFIGTVLVISSQAWHSMFLKQTRG